MPFPNKVTIRVPSIKVRFMILHHPGNMPSRVASSESVVIYFLVGLSRLAKSLIKRYGTESAKITGNPSSNAEVETINQEVSDVVPPQTRYLNILV